MKVTQFLMGTLVTIEVRGEGLELATDAALGEMVRIEGLMSRFLPTSDVARINTAYPQPVTVSPETFWVIEKALLFSRLTDGAFDVTVASHNGADYRDVLLDKKTCQVFLRKPGMSLDLGGIAKGYAVDRAIEVLQGLGVQHALVNAGGEVRALGSKAPDKGWTVGVQHPRVHNGLLGSLPLANRAIATSGDYYRHHHILDPQRGKSAEGTLTAMVVADEALVADALATAVFVLGPDDGMNLIESIPGVEGLLVGVDGSIRTSPGLETIWDDGSASRIKNGSTRGSRYSPFGILLGSMVLISALTLGCREGVDVQPPPEFTQPVPADTAETILLLDGTYRGKSVSGVVVEVEVTVQKGRMSDIQILEYREISSIHAGKPTAREEESWQASREEVLKTIPERIIEKQSTSVDVVTGATMSSETIVAAVEDALAKAKPLDAR